MTPRVRDLQPLAAATLTFLLLGGFFACGDDDGGPLDTGEERIGRAGGTLEAADGDARAVVPPGALDEETLLSVRRLDDDEVPALLVDLGPVSPVYRFGPDGQTFDVPARIEIFFDDENLPSGVGLDDLTIVKLEPSGDIVELAAVEVLEGALRGISLHARRGVGGQVSAFSPFAVVVDRTPGSPPIVTSVEFPDEASNAPPDTTFGQIGFADADGDVLRAIVQEVFDPNEAFEPFVIEPDDPPTQTEGFLGFFITCPAQVPCTTGPVTLHVILEDAAGNESEPAELSFEIVGESSGQGAAARAPALSGR